MKSTELKLGDIMDVSILNIPDGWTMNDSEGNEWKKISDTELQLIKLALHRHRGIMILGPNSGIMSHAISALDEHIIPGKEPWSGDFLPVKKEDIFPYKSPIDLPMIKVEPIYFLTEREMHLSRRKPKNKNWQQIIKKLK